MEAYRDALTGAYNRRYYEEKLKNGRVRGGVATLDLDDFKLCNDIYGHAAGDAVFRDVSEAVRSCLSEGDVLVRYGGDEFLLLMPELTDRELLTAKLERICDEVAQLRPEEYPGIHPSISTGGVIAEDELLEDAIARAGRFMYLAKRRGGAVVTSDVEGDRGSLSDSDAQRQQILIVDDSQLNRDILSEILGSDYRILTAQGGEECMEKLRQYGNGISLVLLDIIMPGVDGFQVLGQMSRTGIIADIPVIMISSENSDDVMNRAYQMGISDYISRPFDARVVRRRVYNIIKMNMKQRRLTALLSKQLKDRERNGRILVSILSHIIEYRNGENRMHVTHVKRITQMLLESLVKMTDKYKLPWEERNLIVLASSLHDIGKIGISEEILRKNDGLTEEESEEIKKHAELGAQILGSFDCFRGERLLCTAIQVCRWHHERYDGGGYPDGLVGEAIPISAQVVSLADTYDTLVSYREEKKSLSHEEAIQKICSGACGAFNPLLLECLRDIEAELREEIG